MTRARLYVALALTLVAGCLWRGYATILNVHLDVLTQTADKLCGVVQAGKGPKAEDMAEYVYPLQRAREFQRQFSNYRERRSYQDLDTLLDRYAALVRDVDAARAQGHDLQASVTRLTAERNALAQLAAQIRAELKNE